MYNKWLLCLVGFSPLAYEYVLAFSLVIFKKNARNNTKQEVLKHYDLMTEIWVYSLFREGGKVIDIYL